MKHRIAPALAAALLFAACGGGSEAPTEPAEPATEATAPAPAAAEVTHEGIDVSHFQGTVDWSAVHAAAITFAYAKATQGIDEVDPEFATNWEGMKTAGLARGAYHFFQPDDDADTQAQHFIATVTLEPGDLAPMLDVEVSEGIDADTIRQGVSQWLDTVSKHYGVNPILYSDKGFIEQYLASGFEQYPLWLAEYQQESPDPSKWSSWSHLTLWQYSQTGQVSGVDGDVDRDRFQGTEEAWQTLHLPAAPDASAGDE